MWKVQAARRHIAGAIALLALVLTAATVDAMTATCAGAGEPDYLVLDPKGE